MRFVAMTSILHFGPALIWQDGVTEADGHPAFAAAGHGGQLLEVVPNLDLVVVISNVDAAGSAAADTYASLISSDIAPVLSERTD